MPETEETTAQIERRILRWMILVGAAASVGAAVFFHARLAGGVAAGAAISVLGYFWLMEAMSSALGSGQARITKGLVIKLILRYPILLGALYLFYRTKWLPTGAVLAGLFVPLAGGVVECLYQVGGMVFPAGPSRPPRF
ncbi:MAG: ATP synthase subunit I [Terriglobia bacterium]